MSHRRSAVYRPNKFYVTVSLALALFLLGLLAFWTFQARELAAGVQESLDIVVELKADHTIEQRRKLIQFLEAAPYHQPLTVPEYISKESALASLDADLSSDLNALGLANPLLDIITFNVPPAYLNSDSLRRIESGLTQRAAVAGVYYQEAFLEGVVRNARRVTLVLLSLFALFLLITSILMHNTVRLSLSANRRLIKIQELIGASWGFISRPYLWRGLLQGVTAGILAAAGLGGVVYALDTYLPEVGLLADPIPLAAIGGGVVALGVMVSFASYYIGVRRYLRVDFNDLY